MRKVLSPEDRRAIVEELLEMGVTMEEPETSKEESMAEALEAFANFVLIEQPDQTLAMLEQYSQNGSCSVGELSGGNTLHSIYRVSIPQTQEDTTLHANKKGAAEVLLEAFAEQHPQPKLTFDKLQQYMLNMCNRRRKRRHRSSNEEDDPANVFEDRTYSRLGNLMFILSLGPVHGQVRHIDHMNPNLQICLYMSPRCPSTIVYSMQEPVIASCQDLRCHWESTTTATNANFPPALRTILDTMADVPLKAKAYAKFFGWISLNDQLSNFGRLYQTVAHALQLTECDPGTTLIAGGTNHVQAGPPSEGPRMFAFAIGIPDETNEENGSATTASLLDENGSSGQYSKRYSTASVGDADDEENDGEVQYSPVLLHINLCCIIFGMLDFEDDIHDAEEGAYDESSLQAAKRFLLARLLPLLVEYPNETHSQHFGDNRALVREWIEELVTAQAEGNARRVESLLDTAVASDALMYSPDVNSKSFRKNQERRQRRNQRRVKKLQKKTR